MDTSAGRSKTRNTRGTGRTWQEAGEEAKRKDEKELIATWRKNQQLFEGKWKLKPGCIHIPDRDGIIKRFNLCTKEYEKPEKVEQLRDKRTGKMTTIDIWYVGTYVGNRQRQRAASASDSCDYMSEAVALSVLPVIKEPERSCVSQPKQRNAKKIMFLRLYLITIGAILFAERPQLNLENLNQSLVKTNRLVYGSRSNPADLRIMR